MPAETNLWNCIKDRAWWASMAREFQREGTATEKACRHVPMSLASLAGGYY